MRNNLHLKYTVHILFSVGIILGRFDQSAVGFQDNSDQFLEWT